MRLGRYAMIGGAACAGAAIGAIAAAQQGGITCGVLGSQPCAPTVCSLHQRRPCIPEIEYPIGQDLRLTVESPPAEGVAQLKLGQNDGSDEHKLQRRVGGAREMAHPPDVGHQLVPAVLADHTRLMAFDQGCAVATVVV